MQLDLVAGMGIREFAHHGRHEVGGETFGAGHSDAAGLLAAEIAHLFDQLLGVQHRVA